MTRDNTSLEKLFELLKKHNVNVYKDGDVEVHFASGAFATPEAELGPEDKKKKDQGEANQQDRELFYAAEG
jgi:uncharacterized protein YaaN involved in tellurite resistance